MKRLITFMLGGAVFQTFRLIACMLGGTVDQTFRGNATTAHIIPTDLSQIDVAAFWVGTVQLAIVAAVGLGLWLRQHKFVQGI